MLKNTVAPNYSRFDRLPYFKRKKSYAGVEPRHPAMLTTALQRIILFDRVWMYAWLYMTTSMEHKLARKFK